MDTTSKTKTPTEYVYSDKLAEARKFLESKGIYEVKSVYKAKGPSRVNESGMVSEKSNKVLWWDEARPKTVRIR